MTASTMTALDARMHFGEVLDRVRYAAQRFVIERKGKLVAAIVSMEDLKRLEVLEYERDSELLQRLVGPRNDDAIYKELKRKLGR